MDDPKKRYPDAPINKPREEDMGRDALLAQMAAMQQETARLLLELKQGGGGNANVIEKLLDQQSQLLVKTRPENAEHPGKSVYSHPEGDLAKPKDPLKCRMFWCGHDLTLETITPQEVAWLNRLQPGVFRVTKVDGTVIDFKVEVKYASDGKLTEMWISFPHRGEARHNHGSKVSYCRQALGDVIPTAEELFDELERLKKELAAARVGVAV